MKNTLSLLKALSDQNRLRVVAALLSTHELCACQIKELLRITGATVSRHMALLIHAGLVDSRKDGRWVYYRLRKDRPNVKTLIPWLKQEIGNAAVVKADRPILDEIGSCELIEMCRKQRKRDSGSRS
ncbi:MAG: metalloregulator ArsR/SmtB family transcription factor [Deltaproteobacteria bacterium]|nr:metalloregulator ArsR/SmtB family transcription factor [Deltaproteobacteria bacterium]